MRKTLLVAKAFRHTFLFHSRNLASRNGSLVFVNVPALRLHIFFV
jgi:hypothetical protein